MGGGRGITAHPSSASGAKDVVTGSNWVLKGGEAFSRCRSGVGQADLKGWRRDSRGGKSKSAETGVSLERAFVRLRHCGGLRIPR